MNKLTYFWGVFGLFLLWGSVSFLMGITGVYSALIMLGIICMWHALDAYVSDMKRLRQ